MASQPPLKQSTFTTLASKSNLARNPMLNLSFPNISLFQTNKKSQSPTPTQISRRKELLNPKLQNSLVVSKSSYHKEIQSRQQMCEKQEKKCHGDNKCEKTK